jgi:hypothetical protein
MTPVADNAPVFSFVVLFQAETHQSPIRIKASPDVQGAGEAPGSLAGPENPQFPRLAKSFRSEPGLLFGANLRRAQA